MNIERLKKISKDKKIPISRIERDMGFPRGSIFKWKNTEPSVQKVKKVADYLEVKIDTLLQD